MKKIFSVVLLEPNQKVVDRIEEFYPDYFKYSDTVFLISTEETVMSNNVANKVGIKGENRIEDSSGVVFKLNTGYSGYTTRTLWEWLSDVNEEI